MDTLVTRSATDALTPSAEDVLATLARHGHRITQPRRAVLDAALAKTRPFTAEHLVAELAGARSGAPIGRSTVYRTLEILASVNVLSRLIGADGRPSYVVGSPGHRHHLLCSGCGAAVSFTACPVDELVQTLSRDTDFAIHGHLLEVFGVCPRCQDDGTTEGIGSVRGVAVGERAPSPTTPTPTPPHGPGRSSVVPASDPGLAVG